MISQNRLTPRSQTVCLVRAARRPREDLIRMTALLAAALLAIGALRAYGRENGEDHPAPAAGARTTITTAQYVVPAVRLIRDDGKVVSLPEEMNDGRPVVLNFVFTTCSSVCPLMSQIFERFDHKLGTDRDRVHLMSISIDPEQDTPARLRDYAKKFHAGPEWQHYTGTVEASLAAQRAFNVWRGDKMSHAPVTLVRAAPGQPWLRIDGLVTPDQLLQQFHQTLQTVASR
jgi:protein SCO1